MTRSALAKRFFAVVLITSDVLAIANSVRFVFFEGELVQSLSYELYGTALFFLISLPFVLIAGLIFALPVRFILVRSGLRNLPLFLLLGTIAGAVVATLLLAIFMDSFASAGPSALLGCLGGFTAALAWWTLVERRHSAMPNA